MNDLSNKEKSNRIAYEILMEILAPLFVLICVILFSLYLIRDMDNEFCFALCSTMIGLATIFGVIRLVYTLLYLDKNFNKQITLSAPRWFEKYSMFIDKLLNVNNTSSSQKPLCIADLKSFPSTTIEWNKYPDELKNQLKECWTCDRDCSKAIRLAAPLVCLMQANILDTSPNYTKVIKSFEKILGEKIDNTQLSNECRLLLDIIKEPSYYTQQKFVSKIEYYKLIKSKLISLF